MSGPDGHSHSELSQSVNDADMEDDAILSDDDDQGRTSYILEPGWNEFGIENVTSTRQTVDSTSSERVHGSSATDRQELGGEALGLREDQYKAVSEAFTEVESETADSEAEAAVEGPRGDQVPKEIIYKVEQAKVWKERKEWTRLNLIEIARDLATGKDLRAFAIQLAEIIKLW
jgi:hypothetical protein